MPTPAEEAFQEAEKRIENARRKRAKTLNLSGLALSSLPESIGQLTQLQELYLFNIQLSSLPESISQLTQLQTLYLHNTQLSSLPDSIGQLTQLQTLSLTGTQLSSLPDWIGQLTQLQTLSLTGTQLSSLPDSIGQLTQLQQLYLDDTPLSSLPDSMSQLTQLQELYLHDNPALGIPPEVLGPTWEEVAKEKSKPANPKTILEYYFASLRTDSRAMNEAKLLLVGQGRVGKTSLVRYLVAGEKCDENEKSTEGINRVPWRIQVAPPKKRKKQFVTLNVWDFGGQEIMHATHQFFLTKRSLYLLVLDAGTTEAENNLFYWLKVIRSFGGEAPVLVVVNKCDTGFPLALNESRLKTDYPNIRGFFRVSCLSGKGIGDLKRAIAEQVRELPHVFDPMPGPFFGVKRELESWAGTKNFITFDEYQKLCEKHKLIERDAQERLLKFLHDLGVALNFDDPDHPYNLHDTNVLNPEWVTDAVYRVITSPKLAEASGVLNRGDLASLLTDKNRFPEKTHEFVLELMRKFELCFDFPDSSGERFLVPERLPKIEPNVGWLEEHDPAALNFQVKYNVLPPGLVCRFIVKMNAHLTFEGHGRAVSATYWRDGCVLQVHGNRCLVRGSVEDRRIFIQVHGTEETRREALSLIRERLAEIHRTIKELETDEMVPVPGQPKVAVDYAALVKNARRNIKEFIPEGSDDPIEVVELLSRVDTEIRQANYKLNGKHLAGTASRSTTADVVMSEIKFSMRDQIGRGPERQELPRSVDFGIITMKEEEYRAVEKRFEPVERRSSSRRTYLFSKISTPKGQRTVVIARCLEQGHAAAQQCANDMLSDADPRWLLLVGIAGAFPAGEFTLGDVLLASRIHDFSVTAALEEGTTFASKGGPVHRAVAKLLSALPSKASEKELGDWNGPAALSMPKPRQKIPAKLTDGAYYGPEKWRKKVRAGLKAQFPTKGDLRRPLYRTESVVTGNALVKDPALVKRWKEVARQAAHVEMELGGVYEAAQPQDKPVLSVRGISDVVGFERSTAWTEFACQTAAAFARALVGSGLIESS